MTEDHSPPPPELKPWYYHTLFLVAVCVFPFSWSLLILRSPWHNGILSGGLAWAGLVVWGVLGVRSFMEEDLNFLVLFYPPGIALALGTQIHWAGYKRQFIDPLYTKEAIDAAPPPSEPAPPRRPRRRRRSHAGRASRR